MHDLQQLLLTFLRRAVGKQRDGQRMSHTNGIRHLTRQKSRKIMLDQGVSNAPKINKKNDRPLKKKATNCTIPNLRAVCVIVQSTKYLTHY